MRKATFLGNKQVANYVMKLVSVAYKGKCKYHTPYGVFSSSLAHFFRKLMTLSQVEFVIYCNISITLHETLRINFRLASKNERFSRKLPHRVVQYIPMRTIHLGDTSTLGFDGCPLSEFCIQQFSGIANR